MSTSVKLKFRPSEVDGKMGVICLQLIHNRKIKLLRTRFRLYLYEWNIQKESIRFENAGSERIPFLQSVKAGLEAEVRQATELVRLLEMRGNYSMEELVDLYTGNSFNGYLFTFIDYIVKNLRDDNRKKTASIYITVKRSFSRFHSGRDILIDNIDNLLILKYETHLKNTGIRKNSISCYMRALRSIYNQAVKRGLVTQKNPFKGAYMGIDKTVKRAVNEEVIIRIKNMDLSGYEKLAQARDLFLFSFYTRGISFVDMANLRQSNIQNGYIVYTRSKTKQILTVKIEDCIQEIITRYQMQTMDAYLLPVYTLQNCNHISQLRTHNKRLKRISKMLNMENPLSSYVARHSWATIAFRKGIPVEVISESMGHENEATTRIYLASLGQSVVDKANADVIKLY
jgi:site-specific recombinase XerD